MEELDPSLAVFHNLTVTINCLSHSSRRSNDSSSSHAKVHELDTFDGTDPKKLWTFLVQCKLCFQDCAKAFRQDRARVTFAQSYPKGMMLEWFEPDLLNSSDPADCPCWMDSWVHFVTELHRERYAVSFVSGMVFKSTDMSTWTMHLRQHCITQT